jgi:hypothetical protein
VVGERNILHHITPPHQATPSVFVRYFVDFHGQTPRNFATDGMVYCSLTLLHPSIENIREVDSMMFTYRELEQLTGIDYSRLRNWCSRGLIEVDGDGAGTKNVPVTFTDEMVRRLMWIAQLGALNVHAEAALNLWAEAVRGRKNSILVITDEGPSWTNKEIYEKRVKQLFAHHPMLLAVSVPHFMESAKSRIANFERVQKFRGKIGANSMREPTELVH